MQEKSLPALSFRCHTEHSSSEKSTEPNSQPSTHHVCNDLQDLSKLPQDGPPMSWRRCAPMLPAQGDLRRGPQPMRFPTKVGWPTWLTACSSQSHPTTSSANKKPDKYCRKEKRDKDSIQQRSLTPAVCLSPALSVRHGVLTAGTGSFWLAAQNRSL